MTTASAVSLATEHQHLGQVRYVIANPSSRTLSVPPATCRCSPQVRPPSKHLREVTELLRPHLSAASCQDLACLLWSFQHFNFLPGPSWMADAQVAMHARLGQFDVASTIMALTALKGYSKVSPAASRMGMRNEVRYRRFRAGVIRGSAAAHTGMCDEVQHRGFRAGVRFRLCYQLLHVMGICKEVHHTCSRMGAGSKRQMAGRAVEACGAGYVFRAGAAS